MAVVPRVIVAPPSPSGGRRVRVDGEILGLAYGLEDVIEFLRRAGLETVDEVDLRQGTGLVEWRGGGPDVWAAPT
ncbi:hypothetical protein [Streptomyces sulfonofaciens]|nr:hypothetical protein [Streptomyces sulfonofaciens]